MGTITARGKKFQAQVCVAGVRQSATFDSKGKARAWVADRERTLTGAPAGGTHSLRDALQRFAREVSPTHRGERWELLRIEAMQRHMPFVDRALSAVTGDDLADWRAARLAVVGPGTVLREMNLLRSILEHARKVWRWILENPMRDVARPKQPRPRDRRISDDEARRMCLALGYRGGTPANASQRIAVAFLFALETGMRSSEITSLTWDRVNLPASYAQLADTKNGDARQVALSSEARRLIGLLPRDNVVPVFGLEPAQRDALFRKARDRAKIKDLVFHDTRHEAVTRLARKLGILDLARMIGHRDIKSLQIYYNATATEIAGRLG